MNTGAKYDNKAFQKSVGLNGGYQSSQCTEFLVPVQSTREGKSKVAEFEKGVITKDNKIAASTDRDGTLVEFIPDPDIFRNFHFIPEYLENQIWNYAYLNAGLTIQFNGQKYYSQNGLLDLLERKTNKEELRYPIIHLKGEDIEIAMSHNNDYGEEYYSFVNGQFTTQGGTHLAAFREAVVKTIREFYKRLRRLRHPPEHYRRSVRAGAGTCVRKPDQDQTRIAEHGTGRSGRAHLHQ